jgi:glycosyltransferase involved in cell wall biosynthesis
MRCKNSISVVIPVHGRISLFRETLDCLISQTTKSFEIIISDDSPQNEQLEIQEIIQQYSKLNKQADFNYIYTQSNLGPVKNTIQGITHAKYDYIHILHTDDLISPNCIKKELNLIHKHIDISFFFHEHYSFTNNTKPNWIEHLNHALCDPLEWLSGKIFTGTTLPSFWVFNKSILKEIPFFNESYQFVYDWDFFFRILIYHWQTVKKLLKIPQGYVAWRVHNQQETAHKALICYHETIFLTKKIAETSLHLKILDQNIVRKNIKIARKSARDRLIADYESYRNFTLPNKMLFLYWLQLLTTCVREFSKSMKDK